MIANRVKLECKEVMKLAGVMFARVKNLRFHHGIQNVIHHLFGSNFTAGNKKEVPPNQ